MKDPTGRRWLKDAIALLVALGLCFGVAAIGSYWTAASVSDWYLTLRKPAWTPPGWVFGPVWTLLYAMMAVAAWLVWRQRGQKAVTLALVLFGIQLALNLAWSGLFFGLRNPLAGLIDILALWLAILATTLAFRRISTPAALLLVPYLLWTTYAAALNYAIWTMNR